MLFLRDPVAPILAQAEAEGAELESVRLKDGFWRVDNRSLDVQPCAYKEGCNMSGGGTGGCAVGHEGPFCSICSLNYTRWTDNGECESCPTEANAGAAMSRLLGIAAAIVAVVVLYALFNHKLPKGALKPFINGMQYLAVALTSSTAKRPAIVQSIFDGLSILRLDFEVSINSSLDL